jgi:hypothetical protein
MSSIKQLKAELRKVQTPLRRVQIRAMARDIVRRAIKRKGHKLSHFSASQIALAADTLVNELRPW